LKIVTLILLILGDSPQEIFGLLKFPFSFVILSARKSDCHFCGIFLLRKSFLWFLQFSK